TGRRSTGPATSRTPAVSSSGTTSTPTSLRASAFPAAPRPPTPSSATCAPRPTGTASRASETYSATGTTPDGSAHFTTEPNPEQKPPSNGRKVMAATIDQDHPPLERWTAMRDAEIAVVWDAHL